MAKSIAVLSGIVFILIGIVGFIPTVAPGRMLLNTFYVNQVHNIVHIVTGIVALLCAMGGAASARVYFQVFGIIYALLAVWGFAVGNGVTLWVISNNPPDTWLHAVIAVIALFLGFGRARQTP